MLTLEKIREVNKKIGEIVFELVVNKQDEDIIKQLDETILFSILGARICYYPFQLEGLMDEIISKKREELIEFLIRLHNKGHFSIFAHTPIYLSSYKLRDKTFPITNLFKVFKDNVYYYLNLRHVAEGLSSYMFKSLLDKIPFSKSLENKLLDKYIFSYTLNSGKMTTIWIFKYQPEDIYSNSWYVILCENISRVCSHQFVRHTYLNFNQKSHRYVGISKQSFFFIPFKLLGYKKELMDIYYDYLDKLQLLFQKEDLNVLKEDFRYFIPQGIETNLIVSGWDWQWWDFVEKRAIKEAQKEIRDIAEIIRETLPKFVKN